MLPAALPATHWPNTIISRDARRCRAPRRTVYVGRRARRAIANIEAVTATSRTPLKIVQVELQASQVQTPMGLKGQSEMKQRVVGRVMVETPRNRRQISRDFDDVLDGIGTQRSDGRPGTFKSSL
jgi:hypothetical protein